MIPWQSQVRYILDQLYNFVFAQIKNWAGNMVDSWQVRRQCIVYTCTIPHYVKIVHSSYMVGSVFGVLFWNWYPEHVTLSAPLNADSQLNKVLRYTTAHYRDETIHISFFSEQKI